MNSDGEVEPRAHTFVREMVDSRLPYMMLDDGEDRPSQVRRVGRCADLVEHHAQLLFLASQPNHRLHKVIAEGRVEPRRAEDHRLRTCRQQHFLALVFRSAVRRARSYRIGLAARYMLVAREDVVGADMNDLHALTA